MTQAQHTPGPWKSTGSTIETEGRSIGTRICAMPHYGNGKSEVGEANARAITAAPDLLEAGLDALKILSDNRFLDMMTKEEKQKAHNLRKAIAKATGAKNG